MTKENIHSLKNYIKNIKDLDTATPTQILNIISDYLEKELEREREYYRRNK